MVDTRLRPAESKSTEIMWANDLFHIGLLASKAEEVLHW